ncbi:MAG: Stk1 family PASTA domain-containing Ser/Thr kinase [Acutalibacteraceae bacterium]|nr:Stk1 family PASTA domain-containing Ser/Thr kinase [Acutalibacteraceae bacterium]
MDKYVGKKLDGRYEIQEIIGIGGMATVYKANDIKDNKTVAIKILKDEFSKNSEFIRRFKNESKAIAVLSHPNIVKVYDVSFGDVMQYIVMEYIDGITLKEYLEQQNQAIEWKMAVYFTSQILKAMQHAHEKGVIHRDVKPQNMMLLQDGTIKVTDFGIARFSNTETRTMTDKAIGSVHYIAPEQAKGDHTDGKSDVYSIGVMLYEMITGQLPFQADSAVSVAIMQLQSNPKPPREINADIPQGLEEITLKAMRKEPMQRYKTAEEMLKDLQKVSKKPETVFGYEYPQEEEEAEESKEDDYSKYEDAAEKKHSPAFNIIIGALVSLLLCVILFGSLALLHSCEASNTASVDVPDFIGKNYTDIKANTNYNFTWDIINVYDSSKPEGEIVKQEPEAGSKKVKEGAVITLTVNSSDTLISVPYVAGEPEETALAKIKAKGLTADIVYIEDDRTAEEIVRDTSPKAGSEITINEKVKVFVKKTVQDTTVKVPDISNMTRDQASEAVAGVGLRFDYEYNTEIDKTAESVIGQSPMKDSIVEIGSTVKAYVAKGIEKFKLLKMTTILPTNATMECDVRVTVDGVLDTTVSGTMVPATQQTISFDVRGKDTSIVYVEVGGQIWRKYTIDYNTKRVIMAPGSYILPTMPQIPTQPVTLPNMQDSTEPSYQEPTEEATEYYTDEMPEITG